MVCLLLPAFIAAAGADNTARIVERYRQMLAANPVEGTALDQLWKIAQEQSIGGQLLEEYKTAAAGNDFAAAQIYGQLLRKAGRPTEAREAFNRAVALNEKSPLPHLALAALLADQPALAAAELDKAATLSPSAEVFLKTGAAWLAAGQPDKAAAAWEKSVGINPDDLEVRRQLAERYVANRLPEKAVPHFEYIASHGEVARRVNALRALARIRQSDGDTDGAMNILKQAIALTGPGNWLRGELQQQLIRLCQRTRRLDELESAWRQAAADSPRDIGAYLQLITLYEATGDRIHQRDWLEKLCAVAPENVDYKLGLAGLLIRLDDIEAAAKLYDELAASQPGNAEIVFARAEIDLRQDNPTRAKKRIEALLELKKQEDSLAAKAVDFYTRHRMPDMVEQHLRAGSARGEEGVLALANFYFANRKTDEAGKTLRTLVNPADAPAAQAVAHAKIAAVLREQNDTAASVEELRLAARLAPKSTDYRVSLAEGLLALNRLDEAQDALEDALNTAATETTRLDVDKKLFHLLQIRSTQRENKLNQPTLGGGRVELFSMAPPPGALSSMRENSPLQRYIAAMHNVQPGRPQDALRLARWLNWSRRNKEALVAVQAVAAANPGLVAAHELAAQIAISAGQRDEAMKSLDVLKKLNPSAQRSYQRRIGQLQQESGDIEGALATFTALEQSQPGDVEALGDLALAQQQSTAWSAALETWQKAYMLAPAVKKRELLRPMLRAMERLGLGTKAAELLLSATDEQTDATAQSDLFDELLAHCAKHQLLGWLEERYRERHESRPDDYFTESALARVLKANGRYAEALTLLSDAAYTAPDELAALHDLVREAEDAGDFAAAIRHQSRLVSLAPLQSPEKMTKLAELQETWLDVDAAAGTWERVINRFPRDPVALEAAARFFERWNSAARAREILRKVCALDPANSAALLALARLSQSAGEQDVALDCYRQLLAKPDGEREGDTLRFPSVRTAEEGRLQRVYLSTLRWRDGRPSSDAMQALRDFWSDEAASSSEPRDARLAAIREISLLLPVKGAARDEWLARWRSARGSAPTEALWAFFYSGDAQGTLDLVEDLMKRESGRMQVAQAFVWLGLQMQQYSRVSTWVQDSKRSAEDRDLLPIALAQLPDRSEGELSPQLIAGLFPPEFKQRYLLWQAATIFAGHNHFADATQLGQRVFDNVSTDRPAYGVELAHWYLTAGDIDAARRVLRKSIDATGDGFDAPVYKALREYFMLLAENERAPFVESYLSALRDQPLHGAISATLLRGLQGDEKQAREAATRLLDMRAVTPRTEDQGSSADRSWNFILTAGVQLQQWNLAPLAEFLWERALADTAMIRLQGGQAMGIARDVRLRLLAAQLPRARTMEISTRIEEFSRKAPDDELMALGQLLENSGAARESVLVYKLLWKRQPGNPVFLRIFLNACRAAGEPAAGSAAFEEIMAAGSTQNPVVFRELATLYLDLFTGVAASGTTQRILNSLMAAAPQDKMILQRLAQFHERRSEWNLAADGYRRIRAISGPDPQWMEPLARVLEKAGRLEEAIDLLPNSGSSAVERLRGRVFANIGKLDEAIRVASRIARLGDGAEVSELASVIAANGRKRAGAALLMSAMKRKCEPKTEFALQQAVVRIFSPAEDRKLFDRAMDRLEAIAQPHRELRTQLCDFQASLAAEFHPGQEFEQRWLRAWADGEGDIAAGATLAALYAGQKRSAELRKLSETLLARKELDLWSLEKLRDALSNAGQHELAAKTCETIVRRRPADVEAALAYAKNLIRSNRSDDATSLLANLRARGVFDGSIAGKMAMFYLSTGNMAEARTEFLTAIKSPPTAENHQVYIAYARFLAQRGAFSAAKRTLRAAFHNPASADVGEIAAIYASAGRLDKLQLEIADFELASHRVNNLRAAIFEEYRKAGRFSEALGVVQAHPALIASEEKLAASLRELAAAGGDYAAVAAVFDKAISQSERSGAEWLGQAALLHKDWADREITGSRPAAAIEQLGRALKIQPTNFGVAQQLYSLHVAANDTEAAALVLEKFLAASHHEGDKRNAKQLLAKLRPAAP